MPSAIVKTIFFDLDKLAWTITAGGNALLQPLTIGQNDTIDFNVQFIKSGAAQTLTAPAWSAGIKVLNGFSDAFVVQFGAPTGTPPTYTFTATISSTELSAALLTGVQFAIEFRDSTNGIVTLPALTLNIVASYTITGTTPTSANGTLSVAAGKTVTFPLTLTFPAAAGTNGYHLALLNSTTGTTEWVVDATGTTIATDPIWTAAGQLVYGTGVGTAAALAAGATTAILVGGGAGAPVWTTATGTGAPVRENTPQLITPALGDATATSINGAAFNTGTSTGNKYISFVGSASYINLEGNPPGYGYIEMSATLGASAGYLNTAGGTSGTGGSVNTSGSGAYSGGYINTSAGGTGGGGAINLNNGGGSIDTTGTGSIGLGIAANRITLVGTAASNGKTATFPNVTGTVAVAATSATATQALFATATAGAPAYRGIASADIATALTTPGAIGGTTAGAGAFSTLTASGTLAVTQGTTLTGLLTANGGITVVGGTYLLTTNSSLTNGSGGGVGTLTNAPDYGDPTKWIAINDNGTQRYIPTWELPPP